MKKIVVLFFPSFCFVFSLWSEQRKGSTRLFYRQKRRDSSLLSLSLRVSDERGELEKARDDSLGERTHGEKEVGIFGEKEKKRRESEAKQRRDGLDSSQRENPWLCTKR